MEDALVQSLRKKFRNMLFCLNPCCNGRCTRTDGETRTIKVYHVLILVVMEDALVLTAFG